MENSTEAAKKNPFPFQPKGKPDPKAAAAAKNKSAGKGKSGGKMKSSKC